MQSAPTASPARGVDALGAFIATQLAALLGCPVGSLDQEAEFQSCGVDSLRAAALAERLSAHLGRPVSPTLMWRYSSITALAAHLGRGDAPDPAPAPRRGARSEPIAIVGMACRFPGRADTPERFYWLLLQGIDAVTDVPAERWDADAYHDPTGRRRGSMSSRRAGFLDHANIEGFDAQFFGISAREAIQMDPQQRLLLELAWEALEDAGVAPPQLLGTETGVFVGAAVDDYSVLRRRLGGTGVTVHTSTGQARSILANRVSYVLGLRGPSISVDTACSSSLVSIHLACQALSLGECSLALAGGVQLNLAPDTMIEVSALGALSPEGKCRTFDAAANGYVRGEGGGVVLLKPLSRALRDGDRVYAAIRGSAVNNDGRSNGLTAPSSAAQEAVLAAACSRAGVAPAEVDYVELHGTGTPLGDPIEAEALGAVYGRGRPAERPLLVGSVKTNIGHLEGAAGIAGVIKTALSLHHGEIPRSLHYQRPNPHIDLDALRLRVVTAAQPLGGALDRPPLAGVSSFGFGGTNAHAILEGAAWPATYLLPLAADGAAAMNQAAAAALLRLEGAPPASDLEALCADIALQCPRGAARLAVVAGSREELCASLSAFLEGRDEGARGRGAIWEGTAGAAPLRPVFVCAGLGPRWDGMGRRLLATEPAFRAAFERCDAAFTPAAGWSLLDELHSPRDISRQDDDDAHDVVHPLQVLLQAAMADLLRAWGVEPAAVLGHSIGEVAAAYCAGALDLPTAARVIRPIGEAYQRLALSGGGVLVLVGRSRAELERRCGPLTGPIFLAGENDPVSCVVTGEEALVNPALSAKRVRVRVLARTCAHAAPAEPELPAMTAALPAYAPEPARVPLFSTTLGRFARGEELGREYWAQNMSRPVRFREGIEALLDAGHRVFIELSAYPVLVRSIERTAAHRGATVTALAVQDRAVDGRRALRRALAALHVAGADLAWDRVFAREPASSAKRPLLLPLSARSEDALRDLAAAYRDDLRASSVHSLDLCAATALRRPHHPFRLSVAARGRTDLAEQLEAFVGGRVSAGVSVGRGGASSGSRGLPAVATAPRPVLVFSGQGGQWPGMGSRLLREEPVFRAHLQRASRAIEDVAGISVLAELEAPTPRTWERADFLQPAIFAVEVALAEFLATWGITPGAVMGHSMGEVAAAYAAGILSIEDAARIITVRSDLAHRHVNGRGGMAAVQLGVSEIAEAIRGFDGIELSASNAPRGQVVAGDEGALEKMLSELVARGVWCRRIKVSFASHCAHVDPILPEMERLLGGVRPRPASVPFFSTVRCRELGGEELDGRYWCDNLRDQVRFAEAVQQLARSGHRQFIEISPHPILVQAIEENLEEVGAVGRVLPSLIRDADEGCAVRRVVGALYADGAEVPWSAVFPGGAPRISPPAYPWQRRRFWIDGAAPERRAQAEDRAREEPRERLRAAAQAERAALLNEIVRTCVRRTLALPADARLGDDESLFDHGLDSLLALELSRELANDVDVPCTTSLLFRYPTVSALCAALCRALGWETAPEPSAAPPAAQVWLARPRPVRDPALRLVCFPYSAAGASLFKAWPDALPPDVEVRALCPPGREGRVAEPACESIQALVDGLLPHVAALQDRPLALCGYSLGAVVAFEVARRLQAQGGLRPIGLLVAASGAPDCLQRREERRFDDASLLDFLRHGGAVPPAVLGDAELLGLVLSALRADLRMHAEYRCADGPRLDCPIIAYASPEDEEAPLQLVERWARHTRGGLTLRRMPGHHFFVHSHPAAFLGVLARDLTLLARSMPMTGDQRP